MNFYHYNVASSIFYIGIMLTESITMSLISKLISPDLVVGFFNAGFIGGICDTLGKGVGDIMITVFVVLLDLNITLFYLYALNFTILFFLVLYGTLNYSKLVSYYLIEIHNNTSKI